jgi:carbonic anhydrase
VPGDIERRIASARAVAEHKPAWARSSDFGIRRHIGASAALCQSLVRDIQPAVKAAKGKAGDAADNAIAENARLVAARIRQEAELGELVKDVRIVSAVYDLDTGKIEWTKE